jgi:hypothetical protein
VCHEHLDTSLGINDYLLVRHPFFGFRPRRHVIGIAVSNPAVEIRAECDVSMGDEEASRRPVPRIPARSMVVSTTAGNGPGPIGRA